MIKRNLIIAAIVAAAAAALFVGWKLWHKEPVMETWSAEQRQADGSVMLERKPDAKAKPAHEVPKDSKVERVVKLEVKSKEKPDCPSIDVDLSLVRLPDETRRVIASSSNGEILAGVDIPVESARPVSEPKWAAGLTMSPITRGYGVFVDRDLGPFRVGAEVNQSESYGLDFRIKAGLRF